ncbi:MAG TPA: 3-dehydroquinate synthase [Terriglobales bacterium]|nr:3-dehydroquinate synthase [Terriglobales bacterium]
MAAQGATAITVALGDRSYQVEVGSGLLPRLGDRLREVLPAAPVHVITNPTVAAIYYDIAAAALAEAGFQPHKVEIGDGEQHKNLATLATIYDRILAFGSERSAAVLALGGGVVGDIAGFAAATVLRGVPYVQVPTTLLAQVDSSVGGKTAINHKLGKNLIGAFYQPRLVVIDLATLATLPRRELLAGLAEVIKYGAILDAALFDRLEQQLAALLALSPEIAGEVIARCCAIKADVVSRDERESDWRAVLNFGHTLGHALEAVTEYRRFLHGEGVAIGMVGAARLSQRLGLCDRSAADRLATLLGRAGLPTEVPSEIGAGVLADAMLHDKKASSGEVRFVCLEAIGKTVFRKLRPSDAIEMMLA